MITKIRLSRIGVKNSPLYQIVVSKARSPRDKQHLEKLGYYDPKPDSNGIKQVGLDFERTKHWLSVGAVPSDTVQKLLARAGFLPFKTYEKQSEQKY